MPESEASIATDIVTHRLQVAGPFGGKYTADAVDEFLDTIVVQLRGGTAPAELVEQIRTAKLPVTKSPFTTGFEIDAVDDFLDSLATRLSAL